MNEYRSHIQRARRWASRRIAPSNQIAETFYVQQPSCQIASLWYLLELFLGRREDGYFVEVGAHDGISFSNSWGLAARGWKGWLIEPVPHMADQCRHVHAAHKNAKVVQQAIGAEGVAEVRLHLAGTLTTANPDVFSEYATTSWASPLLSEDEILVPCTTLDQFLAQRELPAGFDVLVVDVEGFEDQVFSAFDLPKWAPKMMIVELADTHPDLRATCVVDSRLSDRIIAGEYRIVYKDMVNTVFVREDIWRDAYAL